MPHDHVYDFVAVGLGPFNLGLACLTEPIAELDGIFLERDPGFDWHPGMLLESSTLQTPFLADLVTLADPTSPFSFLNYLKESGRLYPFYIRENFFPLRREYVDYCRWAASRIDRIRFGHEVTAVEFHENDQTYSVRTERGTFTAKRLVLGTGTPPYLPEACLNLEGDAVHASRYLDHKADLQRKASITVVGSGQSAAEIYFDLLQDIDVHGYELTWVTRSPRFFPLEYTKLTLELTSPEYTDYFHSLPAATRERLSASQKSLYKGINSDLINAIYDLLYEKSLHEKASTPDGNLHDRASTSGSSLHHERSSRGLHRTRLMTNTTLAKARHDAGSGSYTLDLHHHEQGRDFTVATEGLILATGYRYQVPGFLSPIADRIVWDDAGRFAVRRNYSIDVTGNGIFVQNAELHTHGFVAPDLGMAAYRNSCIIREMSGREHYRIEKAIGFQEFGVPTS